MPGTVDESIARIEDDVRRAQARAERVSALREAIDAVRGTATTRERDISVTVDSAGVLCDLRIADTALGRPGARLSADVLTLTVAARRHASEAAAAAAADALGDDDPIVATLRRHVTRDVDSAPAAQSRGSAWPAR